MRRQCVEVVARPAVAIVSDVGIRLVAQRGGDLQVRREIVVAVDELVAGVELRAAVAILIDEDHPAFLPVQAVARPEVDAGAALDGFAARQVQRKQKLACRGDKLLGLQIGAEAGHAGGEKDADDAKDDQQFRQGETGAVHVACVAYAVCGHVAAFLSPAYCRRRCSRQSGRAPFAETVERQRAANFIPEAGIDLRSARRCRQQDAIPDGVAGASRRTDLVGAACRRTARIPDERACVVGGIGLVVVVAGKEALLLLHGLHEGRARFGPFSLEDDAAVGRIGDQREHADDGDDAHQFDQGKATETRFHDVAVFFQGEFSCQLPISRQPSLTGGWFAWSGAALMAWMDCKTTCVLSRVPKPTAVTR